VLRKKGRRREIHMQKKKKKTSFTCRFFTTREELSVEKRTNHVVLEGNHYLVVFYVEKEAFVLVNRVVIL
jgi:hypothetical protein